MAMKPKKKTSPKIVPVIPPIVGAIAGAATRAAVGRAAAGAAAKAAAKSKATREQAKNIIKKMDTPLVGKALRKERGKPTSKYTKYAIKNEAKTGSRDAMIALKKSGRPTSYSKTTNTVTSPMGALKKGGKPTAAQKNVLNKMKATKKK
jgi:hypothetical protein